ncbi:hypothetical protein HII13_004451 [Brettanomyces bruxellensis]|nr:hypothetical protein HII13_004451 [Brettanomyces bruxellensis]
MRRNSIKATRRIKKSKKTDTKKVETAKARKKKHIDLSKIIMQGEPISLYKVFKKLHGKDDKLSKRLTESKKSFLKSLKVVEKEDGTLTLDIDL